MAAPWEKYAGAAPAGPWAKYGASAAPVDAAGQAPLGWNPPAVGPEDTVGSSPPSESGILSDIATAVQPVVDPAAEALKGLPGMIVSGVTQVGAGLKGAAAGVGAGVGELAARLRGDALPQENPIDVAARTINESTLQPDSNLTRGASEIAAGASHGVGELARKAGVPERVATEIESQLPNVAGAAAAIAGGPKAGAELVAPRGAAARTVPLPEVLQTARSMGIKLRPSSIQEMSPGSKVPGTLVEGLNPPGELGRDVILHNQQVITREAGTDIGVHNADRLDPSSFDTVKAPEFKVYEQADAALRKISPTPAFTQLVAQGADAAKLEGVTSTTKVIGALRRKAAKEIGSDVIATQESGYTKRKLADQIESEFGQQLAAMGETDLLSKYQEARQKLAKINDVETATKAGHVDAAVLNRLANQGVPLTGRLKMIADINENFPKDTKHAQKAPAGGKPPAAGLNIIPYLGVAQRALEKGIRNIPGLRSRLDVRSEGFQKRFGSEATAAEKARFGEYGVTQKPAAPPEAPAPQLGTEAVPFTPSNAVPPGRTQTLAGDLGLAPEAVAGATELPPVPARMTVDVPPPVRGDVNFTPSQLEASNLAGDLGLAPAPVRAPNSIDYTPTADLSLAEGLGLAPPRLRQPGKLPVETPQRQELSLTAPPSEKSAPPVQHAVTKGGQHTFRIEDGGELIAKDLPDEGRFQITESKVPEGQRGEGRGTALYRAALEKAKALGRKLVSDIRVSEPAQKRWADLEKSGVKVKKNPATRQASGELVSKSELKPVFEVIGTPATE